jgi:hypothetical protein
MKTVEIALLRIVKVLLCAMDEQKRNWRISLISSLE